MTTESKWFGSMIEENSAHELAGQSMAELVRLQSHVVELRSLLARMDYVAEKIMVEYLFWADLGKCPPEFILYRELLDQLHARVQKILEKNE